MGIETFQIGEKKERERKREKEKKRRRVIDAEELTRVRLENSSANEYVGGGTTPHLPSFKLNRDQCLSETFSLLSVSMQLVPYQSRVADYD